MKQILMLISVSLALIGTSAAQNYPNRPIRFISPFAPGGGTDIVARAVGQKLSESLGNTVVIENRPGGGGIVGTEAVAKAPPDGYTILLGSNGPLAISPNLQKLPYDTLLNFAPITLISIVTSMLVVHPSLPAKSIKELIAYAKAHPGKLSFSSSGNGAASHFAGETFNIMAGVKMVHIPYRGVGPAAIAVVAGEVPMLFATMPVLLPHVKSGRLRALAVTSLKRSPAAPELVTVAEAGVPGYESITWYGVLAPAGTPKDIIARLNSEVAKILRQPGMRAKLEEEGGESVGSSPEQFTEFIKAELVHYAKIAKEANIRLD